MPYINHDMKLDEQHNKTGLGLSLALYATIALVTLSGCKTHAPNYTASVVSKSKEADPIQTSGGRKMSQLTEAIIQMDSSADDMAARMGGAALPELSALLQHEDVTVRMMTVRALGSMDLSVSNELLFKALNDEDMNVVNEVVFQIEQHEAKLSVDLLLGLLDKLSEANAKNRIILLLGNRLSVEHSAPLDKYCTAEHEQTVALHCMAALAKMGAEQRRKQFSTYLLSIRDDNQAYMAMFKLIEYINQPWIVPSLRLLLSNKQDVQSLGDVPGFPPTLRVCDKSVQLIAKLLNVSFTFNAVLSANYTEEQLAEVNLVASNYRY